MKPKRHCRPSTCPRVEVITTVDLIKRLKSCEELLSACILPEKIKLIHQTFQVVIENRPKRELNESENLANLCSVVLLLLSRNVLPLDTQMLGSIAFCVTLTMSKSTIQSQEILQKCFKISEDDQLLEIEIIDGETLQIAINGIDFFKLCLSHGMLQSRSSSILQSEYQIEQTVQECKNDVHQDTKNAENASRHLLAQNVLDIAFDCCKNYSRLTHLAFRIINLWLVKVGQTDEIFRNVVFAKMLPVVCTNWDSPMNGIREQNAKCLELLIDIYGDQMKPLLTNVRQQPWTVKSKYFVLAALLPKYGVRTALSEYSELPHGLVSSLRLCHLVSAGCEAYRACILQMEEQDWMEHFKPLLVPILTCGETNDSLELHNLFHYWMPYTVQKFPSVINMFLSILPLVPSLAVLYLLKLSQNHNDLNKLILEESNESTTVLDILTEAMGLSSDALRQLSLNIVCSSAKTTIIPSKEELCLIRNFLIENVSADSSPFRQNIYNSFAIFMKRLHDSSSHELNKLRWGCNERIMTNKEVTRATTNEENLARAADFLQWLHSFLIANLELGTNYQRKILSLRLYQLVLTTWCTLKDKTDVNLLVYTTTLGKWHFTSKSSRFALLTCVLNPTEDIREIAGTILTNYFCQCEEIEDKEMSFTENVALVEKSLQLCRSPMFYQADGGALMFKVVAKWIYSRGEMPLLISQHPPMVPHTLLFSLLMNEATQQWGEMRKNLFDAAAHGSPVHGIITAITRNITETDGPEYFLIHQDDVEKILSFMEELMEHLLGVLSLKSNVEKEFAPSFAEMGEAIERATHQGAAHVALTAAHQLVLNCVWLNLKECCVLASGLACKPDMNLATIRRCAQLIIKVLTRCRHKGAIESAGAALGRLVRSVSSTEHSALPGELISQFLDTHTGGASVTRRSAGLAILVHKIVMCDQRPNKPLVMLVINRLIALAVAPVGSAETEAEFSDLPQAQALHFLRTLFQDSSLRQHVAPSISQVAILCFNNLTSTVWTIRNAALQLFGAVVTKLVGQKTPQEEDIVATAEELSSHFPALFHFLVTHLQEAVLSPNLHPTLVPALSLLAKMSVRHPYLQNHSSSGDLIVDQDFAVLVKLHSIFICLLSSHIFVVRKLAAKAFANFTSFPDIFKTITSLVENLTRCDSTKSAINNSDTSILCQVSENLLNGILLAITYLTERLHSDGHNMFNVRFEISRVNTVLNSLCRLPGISYYNRTLLSQLTSGNHCGVPSNYKRCQDICQILSDAAKCNNVTSRNIGIHQWAIVEMESVLSQCSYGELFPCLVNVLLLNESIPESSLRIITMRLSEDEFPADVRSDILNSSFALLCEERIAFAPQQMMEIMLIIMNRNSTEINLTLNRLEQFLSIYIKSPNNARKCIAISLTLVCAFIKALFEHKIFISDDHLALLVEIIDLIILQSTPINCDEYQRFNSAVSLGLLAELLVRINKTNSLVIRRINQITLDTAVEMLQDENSEVRNEAAKFASQIVNDLRICHHNRKLMVLESLSISSEKKSVCKCKYGPLNILQPYSCLRSLFTPLCLSTLLGDEQALHYLWQRLDYTHNLVKTTATDGVDQLSSPFDHGTDNIYAEEVKLVEWSAASLQILLQATDDGIRRAFVVMIKEMQSKLFKDAETMSKLITLTAAETPSLYLACKKLCCKHNVLVQCTGEETIPQQLAPLLNYIQHVGLVLCQQ